MLLITSVNAATVEIEVHGMTCAFCVDALQGRLEKLPFVTKAEVSLKLKKVRLQTNNSTPDLELLRQSVLDAGFTPVKIEVTGDTD